MKNSYLLVAAILMSAILAGSSFAQTNTPTRFIKFSGLEDDLSATSKLLTTLKSNGEDIKRGTDEGKILIWNGKRSGKVLLQMKMDSDYVNRVVVSEIYRVKFKYKHSDAIKELVWNANRQLVVGSYSIDSDGNLMIQAGISFLDTLDLTLLERYCAWLSSMDLVALKLLDENTLEYLE